MKERNESTVFKNLTPSQITQIIVNESRMNPKYNEMRMADRYFDIHNEGISRKKAVFYDKEGRAIDNPNASNKKIANAFLRDLVQQKQDYALSKTFTLRFIKDGEKNEITEDNDTDGYIALWKEFCNKQLFKYAYKLAGESVNHGIGWTYVWIDDEGQLQLLDVPSDLVYPTWLDRNHTKLDRVVYNYETLTYESLSGKVTEYAEYWTRNERILFNVSEGYEEEVLAVDTEGNPIHSQMTANGEPVSWDKVPFIPLKATDDEKPLLSFIKEYLDSYDELNSKSVDGLINDLDPLLVFKGISPDVRDLLEAREIAKMTRTISVDSDGDAQYIMAQTPIDAHLQKMESLRRDIVKFGYGVDYEDQRFGGNPNQIVIKSLYQNLDSYIDGFERQFQNFIDDFKYFFDKWIEWKGEGTVEELSKYTILVKFDRSMMVNQSMLIEDTVKLMSTGVSRKTLLEFNPVVQDVALEQIRLDEEAKEMEQDAMDEKFSSTPKNESIEKTNKYVGTDKGVM